MGGQYIANLPFPPFPFHQASLTIHQYPFIFLSRGGTARLKSFAHEHNAMKSLSTLQCEYDVKYTYWLSRRARQKIFGSRLCVPCKRHYHRVVYGSRQLTFSPKNTEATAWSACCGHAVNQSILQLLTRPGKLRHRVLNVSPTGDMAKTMCRLFAHLLTKYCQIDSRAGGTPALFASSRTWREEKEKEYTFV